MDGSKWKNVNGLSLSDRSSFNLSICLFTRIIFTGISGSLIPDFPASYQNDSAATSPGIFLIPAWESERIRWKSEGICPRRKTQLTKKTCACSLECLHPLCATADLPRY